jgi:hypothetical protein
MTELPVIAGLAQVLRGYNATIEDNIEKPRLNIYHIKHPSVGLDSLTLFEPVEILLLGRGIR